MKKLLIPAIVAVAAISGFIGYQAQQSTESQLSDLAMANIEALADGEGLDYDAGCKDTGPGCTTAPNVWIIGSGYVARYIKNIIRT